MSAAAEALVKALSPTDVKGSTRYFLEAIASVIPEGQTMTAPIADPELAALMRYDERTVRRRRHVLAKRRWIRIHGGGQGRPARYELLLLPGAGTAEPSLPLLGLAKRPRVLAATPLLDAPIVNVRVGPSTSPRAEGFRVYTVGQNVRSGLSYFGHFVRSFISYFGHLGHFVRSTRAFRANTVGQNVRSTHLDVDVDDARAREYVPPPQELPPPPAAALAPPNTPPPCVPQHTWCDGKIHVPKKLHDEWVRRLRGTGETIAEVEQRLFEIYRRRGSPDTPVTCNEFAYWRPVLKTEFTLAASRHESRAPPEPRETRRVAARASRAIAFGSRPCPHQPPCDTHEACVDRRVAAWRAMKSG